MNTSKSKEQSYHHGNLRQALLDTALKQLQQCSVEKLSMRGLAKDVGVSQTALYRHFSDKQGLLAALAKEGFDELFEQCRQQQQPQDDPTQALQSAGLAYVAFAAANPQRYKLMFGNALCEKEHYPELAGSAGRAFGVIVELIEKGISQGRFTAGDSQQLARTVWALVHGLSSLIIDRIICHGATENIEQQLETSLSTMTHGLLKTPTDNKQ